MPLRFSPVLERKLIQTLNLIQPIIYMMNEPLTDEALELVRDPSVLVTIFVE